MTTNKDEKQYGLILPKKQQSVAPKPSNVFGNDNDSAEEDGTDWVKKALKAEEEKNKMKKQTRLNMQKALKEDPTIYQYDEVYDDMERVKNQSKEAKVEVKKPKYIQNLLKAAERRKREQEHRIERMVQKEREAEGEMYADKESFVTSAYRAKLEEFKKLEEEESRMDRLEAIGDVRKQQDMSGFYRHLYEQTIKGTGENETENIIPKDTSNLHKEIESEEKDMTTTNKEQMTSKKAKKVRQYRQRIMEDESDTDTETSQTVENKTKISSIEKDEAIETGDTEEPQVKKLKQTENAESNEANNKIAVENTSTSKSKDGPEDCENNKDETIKPNVSMKAKIEAEKKERSKIWEKRTIGQVFETALQRYYARKSTRIAAT
nr:nuclear speckle splicing regulatory protein 1 isoform X2 [Nomia melanderi]XP_031840293.1 nuclear speckle splicing regulatory protein 1 isoform X2 [Nomia melanderi]XP_031840294.1 nuclear speckle splicing regulatory protein 1 isoform X2 [Nomia melanderi]XP_031840295.1 nuclear speckle splicing regulatory protein 1 isoform X2 [Nomia melanderi]